MIIVNKNGTLIHNKIRYKCAIGKKGIGKKRKEGDQITPKGIFKVKKILYRKAKKRRFWQTYWVRSFNIQTDN